MFAFFIRKNKTLFLTDDIDGTNVAYIAPNPNTLVHGYDAAGALVHAVACGMDKNTTPSKAVTEFTSKPEFYNSDICNIMQDNALSVLFLIFEKDAYRLTLRDGKCEQFRISREGAVFRDGVFHFTQYVDTYSQQPDLKIKTIKQNATLKTHLPIVIETARRFKTVREKSNTSGVEQIVVSYDWRNSNEIKTVNDSRVMEMHITGADFGEVEIVRNKLHALHVFGNMALNDIVAIDSEHPTVTITLKMEK